MRDGLDNSILLMCDALTTGAKLGDVVITSPFYYLKTSYMNDLFTKGTQNRSLSDIISMHDRILKEDEILRKSVREKVSALLMDTSEDDPLNIEIVIDDSEFFGMCELEKPCINSIWQDPSEGWIYVQFEGYGNPTDFDYLSTHEQVEVLKGLLN